MPVAWLRGEKSLGSLTETTVRLVPALFGTAAVILIALLAAPLGRWPALAAAALFALAPPTVYYSRYFIQETLLLTFALATFLAVRAWWRTGLTRWAVTAGICVGLMQATKASAPLFLAAAAIACALARPGKFESRRPRRDLAFALIAALGTAVLLYSSFFTNLAGARDALTAYGHAFTRFGRDAAPTGHEKPWWYYLRLFAGYRDGLLWHQAVLTTLAVVGLVVAFARREAFLRGVAVYTVLITAVFSFFAYKTPWHAVHFVPGFAILAAATLSAIARLRTGRLVAIPLACLTGATLLGQARRVAFERPTDYRNPYAYVHTAPDILKYRALAEDALARAPYQPIRVISAEYWPLPWYLRGLPSVEYRFTPGDDCDGALVFASMENADAVRA